MKNKIKRFLKFNYEDCATSIEIGKYVTIEISDPERQFFYLEKMKNGTWRLTHTTNMNISIDKLKNIEIVRNGK